MRKRDWVGGEGPRPCRLMIVGEAPAKQEMAQGRPLVGKTGVETMNLLRRCVSLQREEAYLTNLFKWELDERKSHTPDELAWMGQVLTDEIEEVRPDIVLTLGALSTHWFLGDAHDMETLNAMPHEWTHPNGDTLIVVPSFHPAASFHDPAILQWCIEAFECAKRCLHKGMPPHPNTLSTQVCGGQSFVGDVVAVDTETLKDGSPYMVTWATHEGSACYCYANDGASKYLNAWLSTPDVTTLLHNALFDLPVLRKLGIHPHHWIDTMQVAFLLQTLPLGLKALAYKLLRMTMRDYDEVVPKGGDLRDVPEPERLAYACADADATLRCYHAMLPRWYPRMGEVVERDMAIQPMVIAMMENGIPADREYFRRLGGTLTDRNESLLLEMWSTAGREFNPRSAPQVSSLLYGELALGKKHKVKRTKWGGTTDAKTLKKIEGEHVIVGMLEEYRSREKLLNTYVNKLPGYIRSDGTIHAKISMVRVAQSGRLAASKPNLLAQPVRSEEGREVRNGYVTEEGYTYVSADMSQIEMRVMAHLSQDPVLLKVFREDGDIHTDTAMRTFGIRDPKLVDETKHRYPSKRTGFGVIYRISPMGLSRELMGQGLIEWNDMKCGWMIDCWLREHPGVKEFWERMDVEAKRYGRVVDMFGRMKYVSGVISAFEPIREANLRIATNVPIQGTAQGIEKEAMRQLWNAGGKEWQEDGVVLWTLQIHDDILARVRDDFVDEYIRIAKPILSGCVELLVPIKADFKVGKRWGEMVKWKT